MFLWTLLIILDLGQEYTRCSSPTQKTLGAVVVVVMAAADMP